MSTFQPKTVDEALSALADPTNPAHILAGGTDLMVEFQTGRTRPDRVVHIWQLDELRGISEESGGVRLGSLTTCADVLASDQVGSGLDILRAAADEVGAEQIKNRATIGGNLGTASPAGDLAPALLALSASVRLRSVRGQRDVPLEEFFTGYRQTQRSADELIESIWIPPRPAQERRAFRKVGTRRAQSISKVVIAVSLEWDGEVVHTARGAAGSVAARTVMLTSLGTQLGGRRPTEEVIETAARLSAQSDCAPIDDVRSTGEYRRWVVYRVLRKVLTDLCAHD